MKTTLCLLVYDEFSGCQNDVPRLPRDAFDDVYAVDGGSTDGTVEYLQKQGIPVHRQANRSLNAAYAHAVELCKTEGLVVFFPKGTLDPSCCLTMSEKLKQGYSLVVAGRNLPGGRNEEDHKFIKPRKWGVRTLSFVVSVLWRREGWRIHDVLHGVKGFTVDAYRRMRIEDVGVTVDLEMTVRAYRLRLSRAEFPVVEHQRKYGRSSFPIWRTGKKLSWFLIRELFRKPPAPPLAAC
jgi:glycosyltransferase involved in cell wall biosynthesis